MLREACLYPLHAVYRANTKGPHFSLSKEMHACKPTVDRVLATAAREPSASIIRRQRLPLALCPAAVFHAFIALCLLVVEEEEEEQQLKGYHLFTRSSLWSPRLNQRRW
ncbi:unnamed protein product [Arctogadus glacialis]